MCGIAFACLPTERDEAPHEIIWNRLIELNTQRGPDIQNTHHLSTPNQNLLFCSSVLHMRGPDPQPQPVSFSSGDLFCFNGEIFSYPTSSFTSLTSDTAVLSNYLTPSSSLEPFDLVLSRLSHVIAQIRGPYAILYYHASSNSLIYCRDPIGRRSLMMCESNGCVYLSSVGTNRVDVQWREVEPTGVWYIDLDDLMQKPWSEAINVVKWHENGLNTSVPNGNDGLAFPNSNDLYECLPDPRFLRNKMEEFMEILEESVLERLPRKFFDGEPVSILFSGGLDCTVLASTVARICRKKNLSRCCVELLNVAFENPRCIQAQSRGKKGKENQNNNVNLPIEQVYLVPDRITGRASYMELTETFPEVDFKFIEINVPFQEYKDHKNIVTELMFPNQTVMDLSIAIAFWFASRGQGTLLDNGKHTPYTASSRVVFSGLGADELLGGYSHHRNAFQSDDNQSDKDRYEALIKSLEKDLRRIHTRNLARDDRLISSHGKELRVPFLCERVWNFCVVLPIHYKCDFREHVPQVVGEKIWLRMVAKWILGLRGVCTEKKRAIQFGAKTAKMTSNREKGDDVLLT